MDGGGKEYKQSFCGKVPLKVATWGMERVMENGWNWLGIICDGRLRH
jgi:hypothetical protein